MATEYYSKLIAKLYSTENQDEMVELLEEIGDIAENIFLYPIRDVYTRYSDSSISHYFIRVFGKFSSSESSKILISICTSPITKNIDKFYAIEELNYKKLYDNHVLDVAIDLLNKFDDVQIEVHHLYQFIPFIKDAGALEKIEDSLFRIFMNDNYKSKSREYAFSNWLAIGPTNKLNKIVETYPQIKTNERLEYIITKVILGWKGTKIDELRTLIEKEGGISAKHIISESIKKKKENELEEKKEKQISIQKIYSNADLIENISFLREKINEISKNKGDLGIQIFPSNEALFRQLKTATDKATLMKSCVELREIIINLNKELSNHGLSKEEISDLLPNTSEVDFNKSLNKLYLYLHSRDIKIESSVFGLRELNQLVSLIGAHPESEKDKLNKKLSAANLIEIYQNEDWATLHQRLLEHYKKSLESLLEVISK